MFAFSNRCFDLVGKGWFRSLGFEQKLIQIQWFVRFCRVALFFYWTLKIWWWFWRLILSLFWWWSLVDRFVFQTVFTKRSLKLELFFSLQFLILSFQVVFLLLQVVFLLMQVVILLFELVFLLFELVFLLFELVFLLFELVFLSFWFFQFLPESIELDLHLFHLICWIVSFFCFLFFHFDLEGRIWRFRGETDKFYKWGIRFRDSSMLIGIFTYL